MNKAGVIAVIVAVSTAGLLYFRGNQSTPEKDFLQEGTLMQQECRGPTNSLRFKMQLLRVSAAFRTAKPEIARKNPDRPRLFDAAFSRWRCALALLEMEDRGEEMIAPGDIPRWSAVLGKQVFKDHADSFMAEELASIAMKKASEDFQTAEDCADPKKEWERMEAELQ